MLTQLKLSNFRIFDDEVTVRFRPITVLIGRNSSGKSSIIKFLLMLQQSSGPGRSQFLTSEGEVLRLGAFPQLKNSLSRKRNLTFELTVRNSFFFPNQSLLRYLHFTDNEEPSRWLYRATATVSYSRKISRASVRYSLAGDRETDLLKVNATALDDSSFGNLPSRYRVYDLSSLPQNLTQLEKEVSEFYRRSHALTEILETLRYQISSIRHLLPTRSESQRVIVASPPPVDNVGQMGEYSLPHLQRMMTEDRELYDFILPHLRSVAGIDSIRFKTSSGYLSQAFARNKTTGADVLIADYGFGVSQCLPILVQGAIMFPYTWLVVEQPEAQLHPTAQLELGSFFADLWNKRKVGCVIETHSDNILLRLRRLIARGELSSDDVSVAFFTFDEDNKNMPIIRNLDVNEDGTMQPGLPMEFFGRNIIEGIRLGVRE